MRKLTLFDTLLTGAGQALATLHGEQQTSTAPNPADTISINPELSDAEQKRSGRLMRVNHAGELAAQGLYHGQALTAHSDSIRKQMQQSADEESDHLAWCRKRLQELNTHTSYLAPFWYLGSQSLGAIAGMAGDRWSLGFVRETERQVVDHLHGHLDKLPHNDLPSRQILEKMREDESRHAQLAEQAGAAELPWLVRQLMKASSRIMTKTAYWL